MPLPKVKAVGEDEVFKVIRTGKTRSKLLKDLFEPSCLVCAISCLAFVVACVPDRPLEKEGKWSV